MATGLTGITDYLLAQSWQIALLVVAIAAVNSALRNKSAHVRYLLWLVVLAKCLVPPFYAVPLAILPEQERIEPAPMTHSAQPLPPQREVVDVRTVDSSEPRQVSMEMTPPLALDGRWRNITIHEWLGIGWMVGACAFLMFNLLRALRANLWLWRRRKALPDELRSNIERLFSAHGIRRLPDIWLVEGFNQPFVWGLARGSIYLPMDFLNINRPEHQRSVLGHELSHALRFDAAVNILQVIAQAIFWFHPFVWWANRKIRQEREKCCDEMAVARLNTSPRDYSTAILETLAARHGPTRPVPSLAVAGPVKNIEERIKTMLRPGKKFYQRPTLMTGAVALLFAVCVVPTTMVLTVTAANEPTTERATETGLAVAPIPIQPPTFRKMWNLRGYDAQLSPDGKSIVLAPVGTGKLCIIPCDSTVGPDDPNISHFCVNTAEIKVGSNGLAWSGNGQWIAFNGPELVLDGKRVGNHPMYVVSAQGGKPKEVYDAYKGGAIHISRMSLSPDGKTLAFSAQDANDFHVYTIPVEGGVQKRLVDVPAREPVFSPDGKLIAYVEDKKLGNGGGALWVMPADGGTPTRVVDAKNAWSPVWSPDGRMIAFFDFGGDRKICIIPVNERGEPAGEKITIDNPKEAGLLWRLTGWTPDNKIGMICSNAGSVGLYTLSPNGGAATLVTDTGTGSIRQPRWSPDRKRIICVKWPCEDGSNWLQGQGLASIAAEGGEATMIPIESDKKIQIAPWGGGGSVSPDGTTIVFAGCKAREAAAGTMHIWTLPIEGGKPTQLTNAADPLTDRHPCWSPDGKIIAFVRSRDSQNMIKMFTEADIYIIPSTGGEPRQLTSESDRVFFGSIGWSPDGKLLAYQSTDKELSPAGYTLRVIPATGGESRVVAKLRRCESTGLRVLAWSPDSRRIAFNDAGIQIISLDDGRVEDIDPGVTATKLYDLDWSRDGARLVFTGYEGGDNGFWLMENFLPATNSAKAAK